MRSLKIVNCEFFVVLHFLHCLRMHMQMRTCAHITHCIFAVMTKSQSKTYAFETRSTVY